LGERGETFIRMKGRGGGKKAKIAVSGGETKRGRKKKPSCSITTLSTKKGKEDLGRAS